MPTTALALRDYQRDALDACRAAVARGVRRMLVSMPTGAGKTVVFSQLSDALELQHRDRVLILAHRDELVAQAVEKYLHSNPGELIGVEKAERRASPMDRVVVGSVQTLQGKRREDFVRRWGQPTLVVTDEAHHATANTYVSIYNALGIEKDGDVLHVGVTATPRRADNVGLAAIYDEVVYSIGISDLIKQGFLSPIRAFREKSRANLDNVRTLGAKGDFNLGDLDKIVDTPERNAKVVKSYQERGEGKKALVFATSVQHSENLCRMFNAAGVPSAHIDGKMDMDLRRRVLAEFSRGAHTVITNCAVLTEGYDEPSIEVVIIARPTKSSLLYTQMIGRGTRLHPGKEWCTVIDVVDVSRKHSVVTLPVLLGLPANFDLKGKDAHKTAARWKEIAEKNPIAASNVLDAERLLSMTAVDFEAVNVFQVPPMPEWLQAFTSMAWIPVGDDTYRLVMAQDTLVVEPGPLDGYAISVHAGKAVQQIGTAGGPDNAFRLAEAWVREHRADQFRLVDAKAAWRAHGMTDKQREFLTKNRIPHTPETTKGDASMLITNFIENGKRKILVRRHR